MRLTQENYYDDKGYLSNSTIKEYHDCPARAQAKYTGEYKEEGFKLPFAMGHLFESLIQGVSEEYMESDEYKEMLTVKNGNPDANAKKCFAMYEMCKDDPYWDIATQGEYEQIFTGEIHGRMFKCKVDVINHEFETFTDIKTTKSLQDAWNKVFKKYVPFYVEQDYLMQLAIYQEIIKQSLSKLYQPYIAASDKTAPHFYDVFNVENDDYWVLVQKLVELKEKIEFVEAVRSGQIMPQRCNKGTCDYCVSTYKLNGFKSFRYDFE